MPEGQPAPKARVRTVADGKRVNIPAPAALTMVATREDCARGLSE